MKLVRVTIREDRCKGCALCVEACPKKLLSLDARKLNDKGYSPAAIKDTALCSGCAMCYYICPDSVIEIEKD